MISNIIVAFNDHEVSGRVCNVFATATCPASEAADTDLLRELTDEVLAHLKADDLGVEQDEHGNPITLYSHVRRPNNGNKVEGLYSFKMKPGGREVAVWAEELERMSQD